MAISHPGECSVRVTDLCKTYVNGNSPESTVKAVDHVSFTIRDGERVGIIGRNGAGKSTLLRLIAGLAAADAGHVEVNGKVHCVMALGLGLREELTGRANVLLDGEVNGLPAALIREKMAEIEAFAELGDFFDRPLKTYSSGMKARIAFSILTTLSPEILIIDEALSVGDAQFARKAAVRMRELCDKGRTVLLVSHDLTSIQTMCSRCLWIDAGRLVMDGTSEEVTKAYLEAIRLADEAQLRETFRHRMRGASHVPGVEIASLSLRGDDGGERIVFPFLSTILLRIGVSTRERIDLPVFRLRVERIDGVLMVDQDSQSGLFSPGPIERSATVEVALRQPALGPQTYEILVVLLDGRSEQPLAERSAIARIENTGSTAEVHAVRMEMQAEEVALTEEETP